MANKTRLIGFYGKFSTASLGVEVTTGLLTADTWYVPTTIGGTSTLPAGATVKYVFQADGTEDITTSGDVVKAITFSDLCDIQTWSLDFSKAEIDVTTLCDDQNKYLAGRTDVTGSAEGVYTIGITDVAGGFMNGFIDIVRQQDSGGAVSIDTLNDDPIVAILYKQKDGSSGETEAFYVAPATITSFSDSVSGADAQAFSSSFRIAPSDELNFQLVNSVRA